MAYWKIQNKYKIIVLDGEHDVAVLSIISKSIVATFRKKETREKNVQIDEGWF